MPPVTKDGVGCAWDQRTQRSCRAQPVPHSDQSRVAARSPLTCTLLPCISFSAEAGQLLQLRSRYIMVLFSWMCGLVYLRRRSRSGAAGRARGTRRTSRADAPLAAADRLPRRHSRASPPFSRFKQRKEADFPRYDLTIASGISQLPIPREHGRRGPTAALRTDGTPQHGTTLRTTTAAPARIQHPTARRRPAQRAAYRACARRRQRPLFALPQPPPNGHPAARY